MMQSKKELAVNPKLFRNKKLKKKKNPKLIDVNLLPGCCLLIASCRNPMSFRKMDSWGDTQKPRKRWHWASSWNLELEYFQDDLFSHSISSPRVVIPFSFSLSRLAFLPTPLKLSNFSLEDR